MNKVYKATVRLLFSHVGLFVMLVVYCCLGARMFQALEGDDVLQRLQNGSRRAREIESERKSLIQEVTRLKRLHNETSESVWKGREKVRSLVEEYHQNLSDAIKKYKYDGTVHEKIKWPWTFGSAVLFCVSIITCIGFGHVAPVTEVGQMLVLPFALLGIPLMLMYLTNVGRAFASLLRFVYIRCCCRACSDERSAALRTYGERKSLDDAEAKMVDGEGKLTDVPPSADDGKNDAKEGKKQTKNEKKKRAEPIPLTLFGVVTVGYLLFGSIMFYILEDWSFRESVYFCFISQTTIAFGDLVPGLKSLETLGGELVLCVASLYMIFGIGIVGMGINLLVDTLAGDKEAVKAKQAGED